LLRRIGVPSELCIPEELKATMLFTIAGKEEAQHIPPPSWEALFPVIVLFVILGEEYLQYIPPPEALVLAVIVLFAMVGEEYEQYIPPPP